VTLNRKNAYQYVLFHTIPIQFHNNVLKPAAQVYSKIDPTSVVSLLVLPYLIFSTILTVVFVSITALMVGSDGHMVLEDNA